MPERRDFQCTLNFSLDGRWQIELLFEHSGCRGGLGITFSFFYRTTANGVCPSFLGTIAQKLPARGRRTTECDVALLRCVDGTLSFSH